MMSSRALKLLYPWSQYLEKHSADRHSKNSEISIRYLKLCIRLLQGRQYKGPMEMTQDRLMFHQVNAILQLSLFFSGFKGNHLIWNFLGHYVFGPETVLWHWSVPEWYKPAHCDLLLDYLLQIYKGNDYTAISNLYIILGNLCGSPSVPEQKIIYMQALVYSMGSDMPISVRHAALNAACMIRTELVSISQDNDVLRVHFSEALSAAIQIDEPTPDPDTFQYKERDLCYLRLLCTLLQIPAWYPHLEQCGHLNRCLMIALTLSRTEKKQKNQWYLAACGVYIAHIFTMINHDSLSMDKFSKTVLVYQSWPYTLEALYFIFSFTFFIIPDKYNWEVFSSTGYHKALSHLIKHAESWENKAETQVLIELIQQVCTILETNPVGNTEIKNLGHKIRGLLYTALKNMGIRDTVR
ncbi:hypothetical protein JB92DRAFT_1002418 [Gautieria morchelliformis]|nr:hypothetical protein JB92DRAFT_1002418 [Gautieria morchelliformis]